MTLTLFPMQQYLSPLCYRTRLFLDFTRFLLLPSAVLFLILRSLGLIVHVQLPLLLLLPLHILFAILYAAAHGALTDLYHSRSARALGAKPIPRVCGRWPGNIDVMLRMLRAFREGYIGEAWLGLFKEYGCTTLNMRFLWIDQIITMDEEHMKFMLATGFNYFWRGRVQKERMEHFLGDGIFNRDDEKWRLHRSTARPFFAHTRLTDFNLFDTHATRALSLVHSLSAAPWDVPAPLQPAAYPTPIDAQDLFARFTLDSASAFLFGRCLDTLSGPFPRPGSAISSEKGSAPGHDAGAHVPTGKCTCPAGSPAPLDTPSFAQFANAFEHAQRVITRRAREGYFWPCAELRQDELAKDARVARAWVGRLVRETIGGKCSGTNEEKAASHAASGNSTPTAAVVIEEGRASALSRGDATREKIAAKTLSERTFLEHLVASTDDERLIRDQLLNILLAARDTTASLLTFTTYLLAIHPDILAYLRAEVLDTHGAHAIPTADSVRGLKYMRAVLNETLRLFPPVPVNVRESRGAECVLPPPPAHHYAVHHASLPVSPAQSLLAADSLPYSSPRNPSFNYHVPPPTTPLYMPPRTPVTFLPLLMQRNPDLWGADADVFDPARWMDPVRVARLANNPLMFAPFGAGPRICLGQNFAYNEASFFLVRLLQQFDTIALAPDAQPAGSIPPVSWRSGSGRARVERCWPAAAMTLYVKGGLWVRFGCAKDAPSMLPM